MKPSPAPGGRRRLAAAALAGLLTMAATARARAGLTQFAGFDQTSGNPFTFTFKGPGASFSGTAPVDFQFYNAPGAPAGGQAATLTLTSTAVTPASAIGRLLEQPVDGPSNVMKFTRNSDSKNLLTVTFRGEIYGTSGARPAGFSADTAVGDLVTFTSDFLSFNGSTSRDFLINLPSVTPVLSLDCDGFLRNFCSDIHGMLPADHLSAVPESGSLALLAGGFGRSVPSPGGGAGRVASPDHPEAVTGPGRPGSPGRPARRRSLG
jgi:hypothetical protein